MNFQWAPIYFPSSMFLDGPSTSGSGRILGSSSGSTPSPSSSSSSSAAASRMFPEVDVKKLVDMGYPRDLVLEELRKNGGNVNKAMMGLFAKSVSVPKRWPTFLRVWKVSSASRFHSDNLLQVLIYPVSDSVFEFSSPDMSQYLSKSGASNCYLKQKVEFW